jgi:hypothetical protein
MFMNNQRSLRLDVVWFLAQLDLACPPGGHVQLNPDPRLASSMAGETDSCFIEPCCRVLQNKYSDINYFMNIFLWT